MFVTKIITILMLAFNANVSADLTQTQPEAAKPPADFLMASEGDTRPVLDLAEVKVVPTPVKNADSHGLKMGATAVLLKDRFSGKTLLEKDADKQISIASITKLMTGLVALDQYRDSMDTVVEITGKEAFVEGSKVHLEPGEKVTIGNLFESLLVASANDAAEALAANCGRGREDFVKRMNEKAQDLGMKDTQFQNPSGLDEAGHYSTAQDVITMLEETVRQPEMLAALQKDKVEFFGVDGLVYHRRTNTNKILNSFVNVKAGKTGFTDEAGYSFVAMAEGDAGQQLLAAVFNDENHFQDTKALLDWGFRCFAW